jgi:hypothetical protein
MQKKLGLIVAILALIVVAIISVKFLPTEHGNQLNGSGQQGGQGVSLGASIPHKLGSFDLVGVETGPEAVQNISRLHGIDIDIVDGLVAQYANDDSSFVLWVSENRSDEEARRLFDVMDEKMPNSSMFKNRTEVDVEGRTIIYVTGGGMENYYWVEGAKNYWVGVFEGDDLEIVSLVVSNF